MSDIPHLDFPMACLEYMWTLMTYIDYIYLRPCEYTVI